MARLHDHIRPGVRALMVGINPGIRTAQIGHHFAGYSNRFWKLLYDSGLVPEPIGTEDDWRLPEWGYGITNLVPRATPGIGDLQAREYEGGRRALMAKIRKFRPEVVALIGVTLYRALFPTRLPRRSASRQASAKAGLPRRSASPRASAKAGPVALGLQPDKLAGADVFVLPNPSGRNANFTYAEMLQAFKALKRHLDQAR